MTETTHISPSMARHPGLDGLRGVAVIMVLIFHSGLGWLRGGFLGVSLFFTLSGFLITALLLNEGEATGRINLIAFWGRRIRRLAPASLLAIGGIIAFASWLSSSVEATRIQGDAISAALYVSNWRFIIAHHSYSELFAEPSPLQHLWSLSIEEQLYVVIPLIVFIAVSIGLKRRGIGGILLGAAAVSTVLAVVLSGNNRLYYGTDTRAVELLVGAALACFAGPLLEIEAKKKSTRQSIYLVFPFAALLVVAQRSTTTSVWVYSGGLALFALLAMLCVGAAIVPGIVRSALSWIVLVRIGQVSYGLYLFHWPIFVWLNSERVGVGGVALFVLQLAVTGVITTASYLVLELPIRQRKVLRQAIPAVSLFVGAMAGVVIFSIGVLSHSPTAISSEPEILVTVAPNSSITSLGPVAVPILPAIDRSQSLRILVIGDSTAENIARALANGSSGNLGIVDGAVLGCPWLKVAFVYDRPNTTRDVAYCPDNLALVQTYVDDVDAVVIIAGVANQWAYQPLDSTARVEPGSKQYQRDLQRFMELLQTEVASRGLPVLVFESPPVRDNPDMYGDSIGDLAHLSNLIQVWDKKWLSLEVVKYGDLLNDPNTEIGRAERPDGVHLEPSFATVLARDFLIPRARAAYFLALTVMNKNNCRDMDGEKVVLVLSNCRKQ